jgi:hypothetical protein
VKNYVRVDWANGGGAPRLSASFLGFDCEIPCGNRQPLEAARAFFGIEPAAVGRVPERPLQPAYPAHV